jgi:Flp pilus assembly protein TadD
MTEAMRLGTQDPMLYYHAGMIYHRLGRQDQARLYLEHALALNPGFSVLGAEQARKTLVGLEVAAP